MVAQAIEAATKKCEIDPGVFSLVQGGTRETGQSLVQHPLIKAVGFTGSLGGGRALFDLCAAREEPIPFFGELGSINPMFLMPEALKARGKDIARGWAGSLVMGAGQFCTNPGILFVLDEPDCESFIEYLIDVLEKTEGQTMLTDGIAQAFRDGGDRIARTENVQCVVSTKCNGREVKPKLYVTTGAVWLDHVDLHEEVFGPLGIIVKVKDQTEMLEAASSLKGQLTCTLHIDELDFDAAKRLVKILERKAGRLLANGFPTGVEVCDSMVHGGPYPASTNFGATSVGTLSIRRFLRPVCYQNIPNSIFSVE